MECPTCFPSVYKTDGYKIRTKWCFMSKRKKMNCVKTMYAGFLLSLVPLALCETDGSNHLTYASIFNNTNYPQVQYSARPYHLQQYTSHNVNTHHKKYNDPTQENDVEFEEYDYEDAASNKDQLLVGFARDPFRYSVPHEDYRKGVRTINPDSEGSRNENRGKRGVLHLYNMLYCATGCEPLSYKGYGCYCGFLGSGRPTDGIDRCCKMHDECYENLYCPLFTVYFQPYYWKCYRGEPLCALENYQSQDHLVNGCAARLCECDRRLAMCVRRYSCPRKRALCRSSPLRLLQNLLMIP